MRMVKIFRIISLLSTLNMIGFCICESGVRNMVKIKNNTSETITAKIKIKDISEKSIEISAGSSHIDGATFGQREQASVFLEYIKIEGSSFTEILSLAGSSLDISLKLVSETESEVLYELVAN